MASGAIRTLVVRIGAPFAVMGRTGRPRLTARAPAGLAARKALASAGWSGREWRARRTAPPPGSAPVAAGRARTTSPAAPERGVQARPRAARAWAPRCRVVAGREAARQRADAPAELVPVWPGWAGRPRRAR